MLLKLYYHPLSSFCWKVLIALYETGAPFEKQLVDLGDPDDRAAFCMVWPIGKFPVLRDEARGAVMPESSVIIEYLAQHYPGATQLIPADPETERAMRLADRVYDLYIHMPMQKIVTDDLRPEDKRDAFGVEEAKDRLGTALGIFEAEMQGRTWAVGESFTMADCAAFPALYYGEKVVPFRQTHPQVAAYLDRLAAHPSIARVLDEAKPYFHMVPL